VQLVNWSEDINFFDLSNEYSIRRADHEEWGLCWNLRQPDNWTRDFLNDSRMRLINGFSLIDDFL